jgi:pimeloyl-ACP methyl ester carboxylesterase
MSSLSLIRAGRWVLFVAVLVLANRATPPLRAEMPAAPAPAPLSPDRHIFYGQVPPSSERAPVIVFVHGLMGTAGDWWNNNDMYWSAYNARYRTAFVSMSRDNSQNNATIGDNALVLRDALPIIAQHYGAQQLYLVGHSKGGLDIQAAMLYPTIGNLVKAVFTIDTPNQGTELADWAFGAGRDLAEKLGLLTPGVFVLRTDAMAAFRSTADPILRRTGVPFYTLSGGQSLGHPITSITGGILRALAPDQRNDGLVTVERSRLPDDYASDLGTMSTNHFYADAGTNAWAHIAARIQGLEDTLAGFDKATTNGLGDSHNTFIWSMAWFKGQLYIGTGREVQCISVRTADILTDGNLYDNSVAGGQCPALGTLYRSLSAEIWRLTPATGRWQRVFKSPASIFIGTDEMGDIFTARDVGFRGMMVFNEGQANEELWVGGVNSATIFEHLPAFAGSFPPPRLFHTSNGTDWIPVPQLPGTFMGDIAMPRPGSERKQRSFRALTQYNNMLVATVADYRGVGFVIASANPAAGNNAWAQVTPIPEEFPVWNLTVFNNLIYATTGDKDVANTGYGVFKTSGGPSWIWTPVITNGGYQPDGRLRSPNGLSMTEFKGQLYIGTNRPTELIRVRPDDSWDLLVGEPRMTPDGYKAPLTGLGIGFGSWFNGHFWRMGTHNGQLYLGTWDWSIGLRTIEPLAKMFGFQFGFDLFRTDDGVRWTALSRSGMGQPLNFGGRTFASTPYGLFFGTARPAGGAQVFRCHAVDCSVPAPVVAAPADLQAVSETLSGREVRLSWSPVPGAVRYRVYRLTGRSIDDILGLNIPSPTDGTSVPPDALEGVCADNPLYPGCDLADIAAAAAPQFVSSLPNPAVLVGIHAVPAHVEQAPTPMQSVYFVRAEDADGNLSEPSNFVGGPSKAGPFINPMR